MSTVRKMRGKTILLVTPVVLAGTTGIGYAAWALGGTGSGEARSGSVTASTSVTVPGSTVTNGTVAVGWSGASVPSGAPALYFVERMSGTTPTPACGSTFAAPISGSSCSDSSVPNGTYKYRVTTRLGADWESTSVESLSVTVTAAASVTVPSTPDMVTADDSGASSTDNITRITTPRFTGTSGTPGNTIRLFFDGSTSANGTGTVAGDGTWTVTPPSVLTSTGTQVGSNHTVKAAESTPSNSSTSALSAQLAFSVDTVVPAASNVVNSNKSGGTEGLMESGDFSTLTFNETVSPASLVSGWNGASINVVVRATKGSAGGTDTLTVFNSGNTTQLPVGTIELGALGYVSNNATFGISGTASTMSLSGLVLTVQLGTASANVTTNSNPNRAKWTPSTSVTDVAGNACNGLRLDPNNNTKQF